MKIFFFPIRETFPSPVSCDSATCAPDSMPACTLELINTNKYIQVWLRAMSCTHLKVIKNLKVYTAWFYFYTS